MCSVRVKARLVWNPNVLCSEHSAWLSRSRCWPCQDNTHLAFVPTELRCCQPGTTSWWERKTSCLCLWALTTCSVSVPQEMTRLCFISRLELLFTASDHPILCQVAKGSTGSDGWRGPSKERPHLVSAYIHNRTVTKKGWSIFRWTNRTNVDCSAVG